jgi:hypothetical protein
MGQAHPLVLLLRQNINREGSAAEHFIARGLVSWYWMIHHQENRHDDTRDRFGGPTSCQYIMHMN